MVASQDGIMQRGYESVGIKGGFEVFERVKPEDVARKATLCENEKTKSLYVLKIYTDFAEGRALLNIGKRSNEVIYIRQGF